MTTKDTGGPAFPTYESNRDGHIYSTGAGLDLRDYFAAKAMQGFAASESEASGHWIDETAAERAYAWADAMLAERNKQ